MLLLWGHHHFQLQPYFTCTSNSTILLYLQLSFVMEIVEGRRSSVKAAVNSYRERLLQANPSMDKLQTSSPQNFRTAKSRDIHQAKGSKETKITKSESDEYSAQKTEKVLEIGIEESKLRATARINEECAKVMEELELIKQEVSKLKLDMATILEEKRRADEERDSSMSRAETALSSAVEKLNREIEEINEKHVLVELARMEAVRECEQVEAGRREAAERYAAEIEEARKKRQEMTPKIEEAIELEKQLALTVSDVNVLSSKLKQLKEAERVLGRTESWRNNVEADRVLRRTESWRNNTEADRGLQRTESWRNNVEADRGLGRTESWRNSIEANRGLGRTESWRNSIEADRGLGRTESWRNNVEADRGLGRTESWRNKIEADRGLGRTESWRNKVESDTKQRRKSGSSSLLQSAMRKLEAAKKELNAVKEESFQFMTSMDIVRNERRQVGEELAKLRNKEKKSEMAIENLKSELLRAKAKLEVTSAAEDKAKSMVSNISVTLEQLKSEAEEAKKEQSQISEETAVIKAEIQSTETEMYLAEERLQVAQQNLKVAKERETTALENLKALTEKTMRNRASSSRPSSRITISRFEFEYLIGHAAGAKEIADKKVAAAQAWIEAFNASEKEMQIKSELLRRASRELGVEEERITKRSMSLRRMVEDDFAKWRQSMETEQQNTSFPRKATNRSVRMTPARRGKVRTAASPQVRGMPRSTSFTVRRRRKVMPNLVTFFSRKSSKRHPLPA